MPGSTGQNKMGQSATKLKRSAGKKHRSRIMLQLDSGLMVSELTSEPQSVESVP
ncbi:MAG: hypothetical protein LAT67_08055 [Balneolales bacterium]|nr:hypothetical protein [Balneolales bacterium]